MGQNNSTPSHSNNASSSAYRSARRAVNAPTSSSSSPSSPSSASPSSHPSSSSSRTQQLQGQSVAMNNSPSTSNSANNAGRSPQQHQQQQQPASSSSRVLRSTVERRRRNNLFSSFYPLLSRGSSSNASNQPAHDTPSPVQSPNPTSSSSANVARGNNSPRVHVDINANNNVTINNNNVSGPTNHQRPDRPPSRTGGPSSSSSSIPRTSTRSPGLQAPSPSSSPSGRTPRGLSRVQRMYDEQSIRSNRSSSSRASSLVAVPPPVSAPVTVQAPSNSLAAGAEPMDVDPESVGQHSLPLQAQNSHLHPPDFHSIGPADHTPNHQYAQAESNNPAALSRYIPARTLSRSRAAATSIASGSDNQSLYTTLSNPRGGTSISSSLLPIRPDSDDEMDDLDMEQDTLSSQGQPSSRTRGGIGSEMVADLIHRQLMQSLDEGGHNPIPNPPQSNIGTSSSQTDINPSPASAVEPTPVATTTATASAADRQPASVHRRRLRSSSMRGLLGFQPTDNLEAEERSEDAAAPPSTGSSPSETRPEGNSAGGRHGMTEEQFEFMLGFPFLTRLLASSRLRPEPSTTASGSSATDESTERTTTPTNAAETADADANSATTNGTNSPSSEPNTPRPRRHNATIRFIQVGGGIGHHHHHRHRHGGEASDGAAGGRPEGSQSEEIGEAIIMYLSGPDTDSESTTAGSDGPESGNRTRTRSRSPWIILTLTGPYLSNLMAAGTEGEGGMNYDDLWMLSNLIGPARPITTTQEAIDNAGFAVGRYEQDHQGIRDVVTLGDGSKCLVCMSEYEEGEDLRALNCKHGFHQECIDKWLTTGANKCPVCRAAAVVSEPPPVEPEVTVAAATSEE
ncbi:hypothetical protein BGZ83_005816 [Gryganskiella cystojenkinii]|nr:hypothetical protein BGZ83_005816 [Gryganskiella cystojenkinii]